MPFFILTNIEIDSMDCHIYWKIYVIVRILLITRQIQLIENKKFVAVALDLKNKVFTIHIACINQDLDIYPS